MSGLPRSPAIVSPAPAGVDPARRVLRSTASGSTLGVWWRLAFGDSLLPVAETSISTTHDQATWFRAYDLSVSRRQTLSFDWDSVSRYYSAMSTNRCFYCKTELWGRLVPEARARGLAVVCDGTNADDLRGGEHRPGYAAGRSAGVRSPLAEAGMTKAQIRDASRGLGLPTWDAPAAPCLSSRVVYGLTITPERLRQVEAAERYLRELGVTGDLRVRHHGGGGARIEVEPRWIPWLEQRLDHVTARLAALGFGAVGVDPRGYRRGSLLEGASRA